MITRQYFSSVCSDDTTGVRNQNSVHFTTLLFKIDENAFLFYSLLMFIDYIYFQNLIGFQYENLHAALLL